MGLHFRVEGIEIDDIESGLKLYRPEICPVFVLNEIKGVICSPQSQGASCSMAMTRDRQREVDPDNEDDLLLRAVTDIFHT